MGRVRLGDDADGAHEVVRDAPQVGRHEHDGHAQRLREVLADLDAGATGSMTGGGYPDGIRRIMDAYRDGRRDEAAAAYQHWLPLINYENRQCGLLAAKALMMEGGVIACDAPRAPLRPLHPATRAGLIEVARKADPLVLRWAR